MAGSLIFQGKATWGVLVANPDDIVEQARAYLGTPFVHQGRHVSGLDCIGLVVAVARDLGIDLVDRPGYGRQPFRGLLEAELAAQLNPVPMDELSKGDIMLLRWPNGQPTHVAIYTGRTMIHSYERRGMVVEHRFIDGKPCTLAGVYRL